MDIVNMENTKTPAIKLAIKTCSLCDDKKLPDILKKTTCLFRPLRRLQADRHVCFVHASHAQTQC